MVRAMSAHPSPLGAPPVAPAVPVRHVVERLTSEMRAAAARRDVREALDRIAFELQASTPEEMSALLGDQLQIWRRAVQDLGIERN